METPEAEWGSHACVPAFLEAAAEALGARSTARAPRSELARILGVVLPTVGPNDWNLETSALSTDWGVTPDRAQSNFNSFVEALGIHDRLSLEITRLNTVALGLYEPALQAAAEKEAIIGFSFSAASLYGSTAQAGVNDLHVLRLTPIAGERTPEPTICSPAFGFDYSGRLSVYDDSGEITSQWVEWPRLLAAGHAANGAIWRVCRALT